MNAIIQRRKFVALLGGASVSVASPVATRAQQPGKLPTIGYLGVTSPASESQRLATVVGRLRELGWIEGRTLAVEYRWAENRADRYGEIAAEFVRMKVDAIVTLGIAVPAVKQVTSTIPIVFTVDADPVAGGLVASLARPGANVTGSSSQAPELAGKRLEYLREILPGFRRLAILGNVAYPLVLPQIAEVRGAAQALGIDIVHTLEIRRAEDITPAFAALKAEAQALYVCGDPIAFTQRTRINTLVLGARLPTMYVQREMVDAGGLVSFGPNFGDMFRRAGDYVDKILRGAKPADLPVEQPTRFELVVNLTTAKALGLTIPETFLLRADEVIE